MRAAGRDPAGGEIPVELIHHQLSDGFPQWNRGVEDKDDDSCSFVLWVGSKRLIKRRELDEFLSRMVSI